MRYLTTRNVLFITKALGDYADLMPDTVILEANGPTCMAQVHSTLIQSREVQLISLRVEARKAMPNASTIT